MRTGNLAEPVWKRSVFRQLNMEISGVSGHYGADCVSLRGRNGQQMDSPPDAAEELLVSASCGPVPGFEREPWQQVSTVTNALAAGGAQPYGLMIQALLPVSCEEASLQADMKQISAAARVYGMEVLGADVQVSAGVLVPQYFLTALGKSAGLQPVLQPGQELVVTKWIALAGTAALAQKYEEELHSRYPFALIDRAREFRKLLGVEEEARAITHFGACAMHNLTQGGIFNALWEMAERAGVGLEVDLKKIPVKQETVEICEYFDINPYYLYSGGSLLVGTKHAEALTAQLAALGVPAAVIGRVTGGKERVILNGEDRRYLDRPQQDEWYRRMGG